MTKEDFVKGVIDRAKHKRMVRRLPSSKAAIADDGPDTKTAKV